MGYTRNYRKVSWRHQYWLLQTCTVHNWQVLKLITWNCNHLKERTTQSKGNFEIKLQNSWSLRLNAVNFFKFGHTAMSTTHVPCPSKGNWRVNSWGLGTTILTPASSLDNVSIVKILSLWVPEMHKSFKPKQSKSLNLQGNGIHREAFGPSDQLYRLCINEAFWEKGNSWYKRAAPTYDRLDVNESRNWQKKIVWAKV